MYLEKGRIYKLSSKGEFTGENGTSKSYVFLDKDNAPEGVELIGYSQIKLYNIPELDKAKPGDMIKLIEYDKVLPKMKLTKGKVRTFYDIICEVMSAKVEIVKG